MDEAQKIEINLPNGYKLVAKQNTDTEYQNEIFVGVVDPKGVWSQNLAIIRNSYSLGSDNKPKWNSEKFDVLVFGSEHDEDFTEEFNVELDSDEGETDDDCTEESYTVFLYDETGIVTEDLATYYNKDEAISFAKLHNWDEVVNDNTGEIVYKR